MNLLKGIYRTVVSFGFDPRTSIRGLLGFPRYCRDYISFRSQMKAARQEFSVGPIFPCLSDRHGESGTARGFYFHQDLLVARRIFKNKPKIHIDVGSRVDGFVAHVASFRRVEVIDIRETKNTIPNIVFRQADMMGEIESSLRESCDSLSCLHALEHFGLGRYGDPICSDGHIRGFSNLTAILRKGGKLYISVPIGPQRIEFNAHRVFSMKYLVDLFTANFTIDSFSYVDDRGDLFENERLTEDKIVTNYGCRFGCGIFEMTKK